MILGTSITLGELENQFGLTAIRATNLTPVMRAGGLMGLSETRQRLYESKDVRGVPFAALRFQRPQGGSKPLQNTGIMGGSLTSTFDATSFRVGTVAKQAALMNFGGTVRPVNRQWLTIPLTKEAIYAGHAPNMPGLKFRKLGPSLAVLERVEGQQQRPRRGITVIVPPAAGQLNLPTPAFTRASGGGRVVRHWLLVKKIEVPARQFIGTSDMLLYRVKLMLVHYLETGTL